MIGLSLLSLLRLSLDIPIKSQCIFFNYRLVEMVTLQPLMQPQILRLTLQPTQAVTINTGVVTVTETMGNIIKAIINLDPFFRLINLCLLIRKLYKYTFL